MARGMLLALFSTALLFTTANAQFGGFGGGNDNGSPPWANGNDGGDDNNNNDNGGSSSSAGSGYTQGAVFGSQAEYNKANRILIIHAILASLVWVVCIPSLAILLRLNIKNPIVLRIHAFGQILSYLIFVVAAGMGIWLAQQFGDYGIWDNPHPRLGLAILALAFFQPIFGFVHHRIYKKRALNVGAGKPTKPPGRTPIGQVHLWLGRILIFLAIINGGLGIRLASNSPFQTGSQTRTAGIAYGVAAAIMVLLYVVFVIAFEIRRARHLTQEQRNRDEAMATKNTLPTYDESEESVGRSSRYR
ncbi:hypothetical protein LTS13_002985 [Exophiala xenobiotica]|nr:hypothetical protein LTS13_002985 [Exophiala xenobiotica]KAK5395980.1 hypothetical protein LTR79_006734 [Exophiala xenobiotica]KAK5479735.1 hypothetical protein LTR26_007588 [Exophiala xenobiotica]KAK5490412.1 hypothetical protein LTR83_006848 [Exophiala xenobiotica]